MSDDSGWRAGPLTIEKKTNATALAALFISLTTFVFTLSDQLRGSNIEVSLPSHMALFSVGCFPKDVGFRFLKFAIPIRIANVSSGNYSMDISAPTATLSVLGQSYSYKFQSTVSYTQLPGENPGVFCKKNDAGNTTGFDFYLNGFGINSLPDESFPLLERGKVWERTALFSPVYVEDCFGVGCERKNYVNADHLMEFIDKNRNGAKEDFSVQIELDYNMKNKGLLWWFFDLFQTKIRCEQKFDFSQPQTQAIFAARGYVTRAISCKYI